MRQFFVLAILAAVGWWVYDSYLATTVEAAPPENQTTGSDVAGQVPSSALADVLGDAATSGDPEVQSGDVEPAEPEPAPVAVALDADARQELEKLIAGIGRLDAAAIDQGWQAVASDRLAAGAEQQVLDALTADGEFEQQLARLGRTNGFLHLAAGQRQAQRVFDAAMRLPDAEAVAAGSKFLDLCLRGHIQKQQDIQRAFVDRAFAAYRVRAERWLCDPQNVAGARSYTVVGGDSLNRIARRFRKQGIMVDEGTIAVLNRIHNKNAIQKGQRLKIPVEPIRCVVEKRSFSLALYVGEHLLRLYWVGLGEHDKTPVTTFKVVEKQPRPEWTAPDGRVLPYGHHENILGEYFIKFSHPSYTGFGAHGTPQPETIGTMSSAGCIRMYAPDIAELFEILPRGATVEIRASE